MKKNLLRVSLIFLTLVVASCGFDVTKITPEFLDTKRGYSRKYEFVKTEVKECGDPGFEARDTGIRVPISEMNGHVCFPTDQAQDMYAHYLKYLRDKQKCPDSSAMEKDITK